MVGFREVSQPPLARHPIFALTDTLDALSYVSGSPAIPAFGIPSKAIYFRVTSPLTVVMSLTSLPASTLTIPYVPLGSTLELLDVPHSRQALWRMGLNTCMDTSLSPF